MSWKVLNEILGLAAIDEHFCQELLHTPVATIDAHGFELTSGEKEILASIKAHNLQEFCQHVLAQFMPPQQAKMWESSSREKAST